MIKLVVFDNNGTLFDDFDVIFGGVVAIHQAFGIALPTKEQLRSEMTKDFMKFHRDHGFLPYTTEQKEQKLLKDIAKVFKAYVRENIHKAGFRPDVAGTVYSLKIMSIGIAIVSAMDELELLKLLDKFGYRGVFNPIFGNVKDKKSVLAELCRHLGVNPHSAVYVDDTEDGTNAAKEAGLVPVGIIAPGAYHSPERLKKITPHVVDNLFEVVSLIRTLNYRST